MSINKIIGLKNGPNSSEIGYIRSPYTVFGTCNSGSTDDTKVINITTNAEIPLSESLNLHVLFENSNETSDISLQIGDNDIDVYKVTKNGEPYYKFEAGLYEFILNFPPDEEPCWEVVTPTDTGITASRLQNPQNVGDIGFVTTQSIQNPQILGDIGFITATGNVNLTDTVTMYNVVILNSENDMPATPDSNTFYFIKDNS